MEGRVQPAVVESNDAPLITPNSLPPTPPQKQQSIEQERSETYIVQIPRDQIYRVPPPENSKIAESYRIPSKQQKRRCGGWLWTSIVILVIVAIVGITVGIFHALYNPKTPKFSINNLKFKNSTSPHDKHANPSYEIAMKIYNPNERMGISYETGGTTSILHEGKTIGEGMYPLTSQNAKESTNVHLTLTALKTKLPSDVEKSMKNRDSKKQVSLSLAVSLPVKLKGLNSISKSLKVKCDFKVNTLATGTKILSQDCTSEF